MRLRCPGGFLLLCFCLAGSPAEAGLLLDPITDIFTGGASNYTFGYSFTVGASDLSVTALGYFDQAQDGLAATHDVGIWNGSGSLVASATITTGPSATLIGDFRFVNLGAPVTLTSGANYWVGGVLNSSDDHLMFGTATINGATFINQALYATGPTLNQPTLSGGGNFFVANLVVTPIPEPATWAAIAGALALGCAAIRRHRAHRAIRE